MSDKLSKNPPNLVCLTEHKAQFHLTRDIGNSAFDKQRAFFYLVFKLCNMNDNSLTWQRLLSLPEVFVYKVPPLRTASGHRAEDWGLASPLFTGLLRVFQSDTTLRIVLYAYRDSSTLMTSDENLVFFGECPIQVKPNEVVTSCVDSVIDSSRYFVLRLKDPSSERTTNIGIGFREREVAFDLKNTINEYVRYVDRMAKAEELHLKEELVSNRFRVFQNVCSVQ